MRWRGETIALDRRAAARFRGAPPRRPGRIDRVGPDIQALIFDFDGLLIDSEMPLFEIWQAVYREHGCELRLDDWQHALGTFGGFDPYADILARTGAGPDRATLAPVIRARDV